MIFEFAIFSVCLAVSATLTRYLIVHAKHRELLDIPNERSSHSVPTPTGGGMAIVFSFVGFLVVAGLIFDLKDVQAYILAFTGIALAVVGYIDDHRHIPAQWRLLIHFAVAIFLMVLLDVLPDVAVFGWYWQSGWLLSGVCLIALVWLLNLFNFMDGIDGIAGVQAITCLCGATFIMWGTGDSFWPTILLALAGSVFGFLVFNWPPAKIFMGDAGSGFLGFMLGALALATSASGDISLWSWVILLAVFIGDSTLTLLRRAKRGEMVHEAHRSHAYQILSRKCGTHLPVTLLVLAVNLIWLLPIACMASVWPSAGLMLCLLAYGPLVCFMYKTGAGTTNH